MQRRRIDCTCPEEGCQWAAYPRAGGGMLGIEARGYIQGGQLGPTVYSNIDIFKAHLGATKFTN